MRLIDFSSGGNPKNDESPKKALGGMTSTAYAVQLAQETATLTHGLQRLTLLKKGGRRTD